MTSRKRASDTAVIESGSTSLQSSMQCNDNSYGHDGSSNSRDRLGLSSSNSKHNLTTKNNNPASKFGNASTTTVQRPKLRVRIKKWHGVAHWTWNCGDDDVCGICQSAYEGVAPGAKFPGDECPVVWGSCGHSFHIQCVTTWLTTKSTCPFCRVEWEFGADREVEE
uniref:Anaphase-promoting complex subunit 11 n=1 Tax=Chaetoceros debilis TaxID=122233 RepID=A0A7S3PV50_9STRA|mmetsp:Transcript_20491/g.31093  ORF Transcript_20491/g.31093 Transcript_20491/m.31093 type:complete len:166 (-) Transcript_20491:370-867(-)